MIYEQLAVELNTINQTLLELKEKLLHLPQDKLLVVKDKKWYKWYVNNGINTSYLP